MDLTIFEIHLDGASFNAPFSSGNGSAGEEADEGPGTSETTTGEGASGTSLRPLLGVAVLIGLALLARYLRSGKEGTNATDEIEVGET